MTGINSCHTRLKKCVNVRKTESNVFEKRKIQRSQHNLLLSRLSFSKTKSIMSNFRHSPTVPTVLLKKQISRLFGRSTNRIQFSIVITQVFTEHRNDVKTRIAGEGV